MHEFEYKSTVASDFYFNVFLTKDNIVGEVTVAVSIGIPKDLEKLKVVRCDIAVSVFNKVTNETDIKIKTISLFEITSLTIDSDSLLKDATDYCIPISLEKTDEKISKASEVLIGQQVSVQLSKHYFDE